MKKAIIKVSIFLMLLSAMFSILNSIFTLKVGHRAKLIQGLYVNKGAYDVVMLGSSHMNSSLNPNLLWGQYGIASYNYGTGGQPIDVTYYLLKEVLKNHKTPIVAVDLYYLGLKDQFGQEGYIRYVLDNMKFSLNKVEAVMNCTPKNQWPYYLLPFVKYHGRWKELKMEDFNYDTSRSYYAKGFGAGRVVYGKCNYSSAPSGKESLPPKSEEYLIKIIDLSKERGFPLIFTLSPHDYNSTESMDNWHREPGKMFNRVAEIAEEEGIPFLNYNNLYEEIGFNFKEDMYNAGHMNIWGSNKVSTHFGKFLKENYNLTDHRSDNNYARWESDYALYLQKEGGALAAEGDEIK